MNVHDIQEAIKKVMGEDPIEMCIKYYEGLIKLGTDRIAEEQKEIHKLQKKIEELKSRDKVRANARLLRKLAKDNVINGGSL